MCANIVAVIFTILEKKQYAKMKAKAPVTPNK